MESKQIDGHGNQIENLPVKNPCHNFETIWQKHKKCF